MWSAQEDMLLRHAAMNWLTVRTNDAADALTSDEIGEYAKEARN